MAVLRFQIPGTSAAHVICSALVLGAGYYIGGVRFLPALPDNFVPRYVMLAHIKGLVEATDLPLNAGGM
jgi:hypothetical protein